MSDNSILTFRVLSDYQLKEINRLYFSGFQNVTKMGICIENGNLIIESINGLHQTPEARIILFNDPSK